MVYRNFNIPARTSFSSCSILRLFLFHYCADLSCEATNSKTEIDITNTASEVMWLCYVATIEREGEKCQWSLFRKERLMCPRSRTLLR